MRARERERERDTERDNADNSDQIQNTGSEMADLAGPTCEIDGQSFNCGELFVGQNKPIPAHLSSYKFSSPHLKRPASLSHLSHLSLSTFMAMILLFLVVLFVSGGGAANEDVEFVRTSCVSTTYPRLCFDTLSAHASVIKRSPVMLATTALSVSLDAASRTSLSMTNMAARQKLTPREAAAVKDCVETLADSLEQIKKAMSEMGYLRKRDRNLGFHISNVETWVSAALTDDRTCVEGLSEAAMNSQVKVLVRSRVVSVAHRTSNALALITSLVSSPP